MKVLVTGATGLIGSAVSARLVAEGHQVLHVSRRPFPGAEHGVDAVINCAGVLQDAPRENTARVHHLGADVT